MYGLADLFDGQYTLFKELTSAAWWALDTDFDTERTWCYKPPNYVKWLHQELRDILELNDGFLPVTRSELDQTVALIWMESIKAWQKNKPKVTLKTYLVRRTVWGLKDWLFERFRVVNQLPYYYFTEEKPEFLLDINFLLYGSHMFPLCELSPYERYLIYLHFREEKTIVEIAHMVQRQRLTVTRHLEAVLTKLRRLSDENQDTSRHRSRRIWDHNPGNNLEGDSARNHNTASEVC